jgi:hypothetical protein
VVKKRSTLLKKHLSVLMSPSCAKNESRTFVGPCKAGVKFIVFLLKDETKA